MKKISLFLALIALTISAQAETVLTTYDCTSDGDLIRDVQVFSDNGSTPSRIAYKLQNTLINNAMAQIETGSWTTQTYKLTERMTDDDLTLNLEGIDNKGDAQTDDQRTGNILEFKLDGKGTFDWFAGRLPTYSEKVDGDSWHIADQYQKQLVVCKKNINLCLINPNAC